MTENTEILVMRLVSPDKSKEKGVVIVPKSCVNITDKGVVITGHTFLVPYEKLTEELKFNVRSLYSITYPVRFFKTLPILFLKDNKKNILPDIPNTPNVRPPEMDV